MDNYSILVDENGQPSFKNIDKKEFELLMNEHKKLVEIKMLMIYYFTYHESLEFLRSFINQNPINQIEKTSLRVFAIPNSFIGNCLNSFYSFVEFCEKHFPRFAKDSTNASGSVIKALKCEAYDDNFAYRLIYNLRTYSTHCEFPVTLLHQEYNFDTNQWVRPKLCVDKNKMYSSNEIQKSFRDEFNNTIQDEEFEVFPYLEKIDLILAYIVNKLVLNEKDIIINIYKHFNSFASFNNKSTSIRLWKNNNEVLHLTSFIYCLYLCFEEGMKNNVYCINNKSSQLSLDVDEFLLEIKSEAIHE